MKKFQKIYVEITNSCNFNCAFCGKSKRSIRFMTVYEFNKIIKEVKEYTDLITLHVKGEPLLHPDLDDILNICSKEKIKVNITTNGSLLLKNVEALKKECVRQINISIHSVNQNNEMSITKEKYLSDIFSAVDILKKNNFKLYISYRLWNLKDISENSENYDLIKALENKYNIENLVDISKKNLFVELSSGIFLNQDIEFKWPSMDDDIISNEGRCLGLKNQIGILSDGSVVPCCLDQDANVYLGNVFNDSLKNILESKKVIDIIKGFELNKILPELCKRCTYREKFSK